MPDSRKALDGTAIGLMLFLTVLWGFNHVAAKLAAPGISLVMQSAIRSIIAAALIVIWARWKGIPLFNRDGSLPGGLLAGLLFTAEFYFIFAGLYHTTAARMTLLLYVQPGVTALGLAWLVPSERLKPTQWFGVLLGFVGLAIAFADGFADGGRNDTLKGDLYALIAGVCWGATTVAIRATKLAAASAAKTTLYQVGLAAPILYVCSLALGEPGVVEITPIVAVSMFHQSVVVAFVSLLVWFWMMTKYLAGRLAVFTFLTPLFGVAAGALVLGDPVSPRFLVAAIVVGVGIVLVNVRR